MKMHTMNPTLTLARESGIRRKSIGRIKGGFIYLTVGSQRFRNGGRGAEGLSSIPDLPSAPWLRRRCGC